MGVPRTGLHTGTRFSVRSGRNGTDYTTLIRIARRRTHRSPLNDKTLESTKDSLNSQGRENN